MSLGSTHPTAPHRRTIGGTITKRFWSDHERAEGTSVLLPIVLNSTGTPPNAARVVTLGGLAGKIISYTAEVFTDNATKGTWADTAKMTYQRLHVNGVLLPDGNVFVVGGESVACADPFNTCSPTVPMCGTPVYEPELYNPTGSGSFTLLPSMSRPRAYHSIGTLLPDGSVLVAGGETDRYCSCVGRAAPCPTAEIYYPGYLFRDPRPSLYAFGSPSERVMRYGQPFSFYTPEYADPSLKVVLIRPGAVTHSFDQDQRSVQLAITGRSQNPNDPWVTVQAPLHENIAPRGHYMLFLVKNDSMGRGPVPSKAAFIQLVR